jgi:hypothetical protein
MRIPNLKKKKECKKVLLLGSNGRGLSDRLRSVLGSEYIITSIFKPNAELRNVAKDLKALSKDMTKDDHVIIVGGPGNSLDLERNYQIEKDLLAFSSVMTSLI